MSAFAAVRRRMCCYVYPNPGYACVSECFLLLLHILLHAANAAINEFSCSYLCVLIYYRCVRDCTRSGKRRHSKSRGARKKRVASQVLSLLALLVLAGTKVQILTQKESCPHRATPSSSRAQGTRCSCARCSRSARRGVHSA